MKKLTSLKKLKEKYDINDIYEYETDYMLKTSCDCRWRIISDENYGGSFFSGSENSEILSLIVPGFSTAVGNLVFVEETVLDKHVCQWKYSIDRSFVVSVRNGDLADAKQFALQVGLECKEEFGGLTIVIPEEKQLEGCFGLDEEPDEIDYTEYDCAEYDSKESAYVTLDDATVHFIGEKPKPECVSLDRWCYTVGKYSIHTDRNGENPEGNWKFVIEK